MPRPKKQTSYLDKLQTEVESNQSRLSLILGVLIVVVVGILIFNYFNKNKAQVGPAQQTEQGDISPENLPGKYTVKEGDTLFTVAEKYYKDGSLYTEIVKVNNLANENAIETGQVLEIPKLTVATSPMPAETVTPSPSPTTEPQLQPSPDAKGGIPSAVTSYGPTITGDKYTVVEGDWLSTIAARAYNGDILAYQKLAQANNISNPDLIFPGQVITIPR